MEDQLGARAEKMERPLPAAYRRAFARIARDPDERLMVAESGGRIVGTFHLSVMQQLAHAGGKVAQIESVRVAAAERGRGLGRRMMLWALAYARKSGCHRAQLTSNRRRRRARRFYERLGFRPTHAGFKLVF
jgi:GNAT superfamily N-acetyltransferase